MVQQGMHPFEEIYVDFCGQMKPNKYGKRYVLAIIDQFSRYISLNAVTKQDEETTVKTIVNNWILKFGAPRIIHVDCGKSFESNLMKLMAQKYNIKLQFSSPYHHNTNGLVERQFRTIRDFMNATLVKERKKLG